MSRRLKGFRGRWSLSKMHSAKGTAFFKSLKPGAQRQWAGWDSKQSRRIYKKKGWM